jgi:O-Antigen ligase
MIGAKEQSRITAFRRSWLMWIGPLPALSAATALAVVSGGSLLRSLMLSGALWLMALPLLSSLEAGLLAMMIFEPMRGFLRRAQFIFVEYTTTDPIHLVTPLLTVLAFTILLWKRREQLFMTKPLGLPVSILASCFFIQIFNPFQGGMFVGMSGAFFILLPVAWFYFGCAMKPAFLSTAFRLIVVMGLICSLHGAYQLVFGFPSFEQYWVNHTDHYESIAVGHIQRALATFNSAEEWGRYVQFGALIAFGFAVGAKQLARRLGWMLCLAGLSSVLVMTGQRTAIFGLAVGLGVFILLGAENWVRVIKRGAIMGITLGVLVLVAKPPSEQEMWSKDKDDKVGTMLSHTTRGTLQPTKEGSLDERFRIWGILVTKIIPARPLGTGISAGTVASARYADVTSELYPIDSFVAVLLVGCSLPVALLFVGILVRIQWIGVRVFKSADSESQAAIVRRIAAAIISMLILNSIFGLTFMIYSAAPIAWMVIGWICSESARDEQQLAGELSHGF